MNAYEYLKENNIDTIDKAKFYQLIKDFMYWYLKAERYQERVQNHRKPMEVVNDFSTKLNDYSIRIQNRPEMRDTSLDGKASSYVPTIVGDLWRSDKRLRSLFNAVKTYCEIRNKDIKTIAVHIAEYRAIVKLFSKMQREIRKSLIRPPYTFEDWLANKFYNEKTMIGEFVANDSENYLHLVEDGKMSYETLNTIQEAQQKAYDYMIDYSVLLNERQFNRQTKDTLDFDQTIKAKIGKIENYMKGNPDLCEQVALPKTHRSIKFGAKFLLPQHYTAFLNKEVSDVFTPKASKYMLNVHGTLTSFPTPEQTKYAEMEATMKWLQILKGYEYKIRYEQMMAVPDFKTLIKEYGKGGELLAQFQKGLEFAPDRNIYIANRVQSFESVLPKFQSSIFVQDIQNKQSVQVHTGDYRRIGYAWVNNGHNASKADLEAITAKNVTLCQGVSYGGRFSVYNEVLSELAQGGAIAFHIAFLREQLQNRNNPKKPKNSNRDIWQGSEVEKRKLVENLCSELFIENTGENKASFLNNKPVRWLADGRSLFYLLTVLKEKPYRKFLADENLGPLVARNFINKDGDAFKNISQNLSGMINANKSSRPRNGDRIDTILKLSFSK